MDDSDTKSRWEKNLSDSEGKDWNRPWTFKYISVNRDCMQDIRRELGMRKTDKMRNDEIRKRVVYMNIVDVRISTSSVC